jgi:hypothetical protein
LCDLSDWDGIKNMNLTRSFPLVLAAVLSTLLTVDAVAQSNDGSQTSYQVSPDASAPSNVSTNGPVRLARFSLVQGDVSWRPTAEDDWSIAGVNVPIREGAQVWVTSGGRAEIQFDDGSYVRIGDGAVVTLQTLYSDEDGEFTELSLSQGIATLDLKNKASIYQLDTPLTSVKAAGISNVRVGVNDGAEVAVHDGSATITGPGGTASLSAGDYIYLADSTTPLNITPVPPEDSWDHWNDVRDDLLADDQTAQYCPPNIALCAGDLASYGRWRHDPDYGWVWYPQVSDPTWRPYEQGSWVYCQPFGWTWCSSEPWGWAPYHYGTWFHSDDGWAWCPGPSRQYWSPAVVSFSNYQGNVGWCPLAPREVNYAALDIAIPGRGFFLGFSIGQAGCYYPGPSGSCVGRPFANNYVNRYGRPGFRNHNETVHRYTNITNLSNITIVHNVFVPANARYGGVMTSSVSAFGGSGGYHPAPTNGEGIFTHGHVVTLPQSGVRPFSGPPSLHPAVSSWTPNRAVQSTIQPASIVFTRPLVRAPLPTKVARIAAPVVIKLAKPNPGVDVAVQTYRPPTGSTFTGPAHPVIGLRTSPDTGYTKQTGVYAPQTTTANTFKPIGSIARTPVFNRRPVAPTQSFTTVPVVHNPQSSFQRGGGIGVPYQQTPTAPPPVRRVPASYGVQGAVPPSHVPYYNNPNSFRIDDRNSGGGVVPSASMPTSSPVVQSRPQRNVYNPNKNQRGADRKRPTN